MLAVIAAVSVAFGALVAAALVGLSGGRQKRRPRPGAARALRRGAVAGSIVGLLAVLRVIDGLTPITAAFVIVPFVLAEVVLSARTA